MDAAYKILQDNNVRQVSAHPITIPASNPGAAGIKAIKFRDPEGHDLELIYFPRGKGNASWQKPTNRLFRGIDHTAMTVDSTEKGVTFYRDSARVRGRRGHAQHRADAGRAGRLVQRYLPGDGDDAGRSAAPRRVSRIQDAAGRPTDAPRHQGQRSLALADRAGHQRHPGGRPNGCAGRARNSSRPTWWPFRRRRRRNSASRAQ